MKFLLIILVLVITTCISGQQSKLSKTVNEISAYIASENFHQLKINIGDVSATDSIYQRALSYTDYDYSETLLALMFATVPYREVPVQIPFLDIILYYPLISSEKEIFCKKNQNLPRYLFLDTKTNDFGDIDKLAHFFGSAFLSYETRFFDLGELIGYFVEVFEESFKVQSSIDLRDLDVNQYGRIFGKELLRNKNLQPSQLILLRSLRNIRIIL
jgi:hypothetical protein